MESQQQKGIEPPKDQPGKPQHSLFKTGTIEIVLQFLPVNGSPNDRRIRHMLSLNGKALALSTLRAGELTDLLSSLGTLSPEAMLARLEEYVMQRQQQVNELQRLRATSATPSRQASRSKSAEVQPLASPSRPQAPSSPQPEAQTDAEEMPQQLTLF
jgi:hypothetical protein